MTTKTLKRNVFQRLLGIPATKTPGDADCWQFNDGKLTVDLNAATELNAPWGAVCLSDESLPERVLLFRDDEDHFHAVQNKCSHAGRRLDPVPGTECVQCCSMGKSTFSAEDGTVISGSTKKPIKVYTVAHENDTLTIVGLKA